MTATCTEHAFRFALASDPRRERRGFQPLFLHRPQPFQRRPPRLDAGQIVVPHRIVQSPAARRREHSAATSPVLALADARKRPSPPGLSRSAQSRRGSSGGRESRPSGAAIERGQSDRAIRDRRHRARSICAAGDIGRVGDDDVERSRRISDASQSATTKRGARVESERRGVARQRLAAAAGRTIDTPTAGGMRIARTEAPAAGNRFRCRNPGQRESVFPIGVAVASTASISVSESGARVERRPRVMIKSQTPKFAPAQNARDSGSWPTRRSSDEGVRTSSVCVRRHRSRSGHADHAGDRPIPDASAQQEPRLAHRRCSIPAAPSAARHCGFDQKLRWIFRHVHSVSASFAA